MNSDTFFDSRFLQKLERLALVTRRRRAAGMKGERRSPRRGTSLEFIDYRHYVAGDDPRQVDWNAYGRSGNLFVKLFEEEEILTAHLILDVSRSMDWGTPNKSLYGRRLAAAIGYVVLAELDRVAAAKISGDVDSSFGPVWGRRHASRLFDFFSTVGSHRQTDFDAALARYVEAHPRPGLAVLISDLLSPTAEAGIRRLVARRYEVVVLHLLCPQEERPPVAEGLRLVDCETGNAVEMYLDQQAASLYQERFAEWCSGLQTFCSHHNVVYQRLSTADPLERVVFGLLQNRGILR